jgi:hypothetical protein
MDFENARWSDADQTSLLADVDGVEMGIPADARNRHYRELLDAGVAVADCVELEVVPVVSQDELIATLLARIEALEAPN